jgi:hypothetical protein
MAGLWHRQFEFPKALKVKVEGLARECECLSKRRAARDDVRYVREVDRIGGVRRPISDPEQVAAIFVRGRHRSSASNVIPGVVPDISTRRIYSPESSIKNRWIEPFGFLQVSVSLLDFSLLSPCFTSEEKGESILGIDPDGVVVVVDRTIKVALILPGPSSTTI